MIEGPPPQAAQAAGPLFIGSDIYRGSSYGPGHPLRVPRVSTVMDLARALGWLPAGRFRLSPRAKPAALALWHDPAYVVALQAAEIGIVSDTLNTGNAETPVRMARRSTHKQLHSFAGTIAPAAAR